MAATISDIMERIRIAGGTPMYVGGAVRDAILDIKSKDIDVEVFGLEPNELWRALCETGVTPYTVGKSFGIYKVYMPEAEYDFSLPRIDSKTGSTHTDFDVKFDPHLSIPEAAARRDFTINAIYLDPRTGQYIDPFNGRGDLETRTLRATSSAFGEDPLRVYRGMQFCSRFGLVATPTTINMCQAILDQAETISLSRLWVEWSKWAMGDYPSIGLDFLRDTGWIDKHPMLKDIIGVPQEPEWHPEGDVWDHTRHVVDAMANICARHAISSENRLVLMFSALLHDIGKPKCTITNDKGRIVSPEHDEVGAKMVDEFMDNIWGLSGVTAKVECLVAEHMAHLNASTPRSARRLAVRLAPATMTELVLLIEADYSGRPPLPKGLPESARLLMEHAVEVHVTGGPQQPILMGRHLIAQGYPGGPKMGTILKHALEAQLDGKFHDLEGAMDWLRVYTGVMNVSTA